MEVATDHFSFRSAESGLERPGALKQKPPTEAERLRRLEEGMASIQEALQALRPRERTEPAVKPMSANPKPRARQKKKDFPGLDPAVVQSALTAGVPAEHLEELGGILREKPRRLDDLERKAQKINAGPLDDIPLAEEEEEPEEEAEEAEGTGGSGAVEAALVQLTKIASHLTESKRRDPLESLLDGGGSGAAGSDGSGLPTSKRNAAALRALQKCLKENPKYLYQCLEANLQSDFLSRPVQPGEPLTPGTTARGWLAAKSRVLNYTNHVRWSWQAAGIWDALMAGKVEEARARAGLLVASADQSSIDGQCQFAGKPPTLPAVQQPPSAIPLREPVLSPLRPEVAGHLHGTREGSRQLPGGEEKAGKGWGQEGRQGGRCCSKSQSQSEGERRQRRKRERKEPVRRGWKLEGGDDAEPPLWTEEEAVKEELDSRSGGIHLPGSKASTFEGRAILNSSLRHLLRARCRLGCFARSFCHQRFDRASEHGTAFGELFPLPLPYPEVLCKGATDEDGRLALKRGVSAVIIILNYLHLGRPRCCAKELRMRRPLSKKQWSGVKRLEFLMKAWIEVSPIDAEGMGRTAAKVESIEETLKKLEVAAATHVSQQCNYFRGGDRRGVDCLGEKSRGVKIGWMPDEAGFTTFKKVEADRLTFVGTPSFDPTPYLDERSQAIFNDPIQCRNDPASYRGPVPKLKVHCHPDEKLKLYELLDASNRLGVHRRGEVSLKFGSGLFAVTKDLSRDRLILDSRGANLLEKPAQRWIRSLACGESLVKLVLKKGEVLRASGNDLRDFYYLFRCSESRSRRNFLVGEVPARKLQHLHSVREKGFATGMLVGSLRTLAMGDTQAVELAQTCHLSLALNGGVVSRSSVISMHQPLPRGTQLTGLVIDDYISMSIDSEKDCEKPSRGAEKADLMTEEYKRVGLIPNEKKAFRDEEDSTFWGADLRGRDGLVRGSLKRAIPLAGIILKIVQARTATCLLLETIAGSLISLFLYRRRLLSLMDSVFASYRGREDREIVKLDGRTLSDLLCMSCLLPLAVTNLRAKVSPRLTATDASSWGEAGVVASVPERIIEEIYRHTLKKSLWVRLLSPARALQRQKNLLQPEDEIPNPEDRFHSHPLWQSLAEGLDFRVLFSKSKTSSRRINVGELRAMLRSEHLHALGEPESREVYALDSQVALGCLLKGRSSSSALNEELVGSLPVMLLQDKYSEGIYFETSVNPGDDPTRGKEVRKPTKSLPWWWEELKNGCYAGFDDWMRRHDVHPDETCGLPEFAELLHGKLL